jgi:hypothetical protein
MRRKPRCFQGNGGRRCRLKSRPSATKSCRGNEIESADEVAAPASHQEPLRLSGRTGRRVSIGSL